MTTNKELRELAEKATPGAWGKDGVYVCTTITAGETIYVQTWDAVAESHQESNAQFIAAANPATVLALLDENEALQADRARLMRDLQNLIDQTTPLEPVPGNPMWSRRIQLDEVMAERDQLRAACEKLRKDAERYQWLKHHAIKGRYDSDWEFPLVGAWEYRPCSEANVKHETLDAAIDAAMETTK